MKPTNLIALTGKAGCGKDTVGDYLVKHHGYVRVAFADPIKYGLNAIFGWTMAQWEDREWKEAIQSQFGKSPRQMAQTLGTEWGREQVHNDLWVILAMNRVKSLLNEHVPVVITDCRFNNEAEVVRAAGGVVWHIVRPTVQAVAAHASEGGVDFYPNRDEIFKNAGTFQDLFSSVDLVLDFSKN